MFERVLDTLLLVDGCLTGVVERLCETALNGQLRNVISVTAKHVPVVKQFIKSLFMKTLKETQPVFTYSKLTMETP